MYKYILKYDETLNNNKQKNIDIEFWNRKTSFKIFLR